MTLLVAVGATHTADLAVTTALQAVASYPLDVLANADTFVGQATLATLLALVATAYLWRREPGGAWLAAGLLAVTVVGEVVLKFTLDHPSPPQAFDRTLWDPFGVHVVSPSSFPSGHVSRVAFLSILVMPLVRSRTKRWLVVLITVTFWARIYIGDHWLSDAVGGLALGAAAGLAALWWIARCRAYAASR